MSGESRSVLIVDDEPPARERLERLLSDLGGWNVVASCGTGREALELTVRLEPAIVLLDVRMPGMSGIETARHLGAMDSPPAIVLTTAYDEYALEAFDAQAVGYLLKPIRRERLEAALKHASRLSGPALRSFAQAKSPFSERQHVAVRTRTDLKLVPIADVRYFKADQKYVTVCHRQGEELLEESLKELEEEFASRFVRTHRSLLVAVAHIEALERNEHGGYAIRLRGVETPLPVSRRQISDVKARLRSGR